MFLKINSIRTRLILYCIGLVLSSLFIVSSFFYFTLSHSWRKQDYQALEFQTHYFAKLFEEKKLQQSIVNEQLLVLVFKDGEKIFTHFPKSLHTSLESNDKIDKFELELIRSQANEFWTSSGVKTLLLLDGDENKLWEKLEVGMTRFLISHNLKTLATFIDDDFFEVFTKKMDNGLVVVVGKFAEEREEKLSDLRYLALISFFPCLILTLILSYLMSRSFLNPIDDLLSVIKRMQKGERNLKAEISEQDDEVNILKKEFNYLVDKNEALVKSLKETLDNVAHDLKTPLTHFRVSAEAALSGDDPIRLREALAEGIESSEFILRILKSLMDIQEVESGTLYLKKQVFRLDHLVSDVLEMFSFIAEEKEITFETELTPCEVWADQSRLFQVVTNLIDNALKFSTAKGRIWISLNIVAAEIKLTVKDQGQGIASDSIDRIWERLYREESSRHTPGAGIGLSIVAAYVKAHGGRIEVKSLVNEGSEFTVTLPFCNSAER